MVGPGTSHMKGTICFRLAMEFGIIFGIKIHLVPPKFNINEFSFLAYHSCRSASILFYLYNPSGLWSLGTPWTLSEWTAWGIVAYRGIILFSDSFRCTYQIYAASGRLRSTEGETPRIDVMWCYLTFILLRVMKKRHHFWLWMISMWHVINLSWPLDSKQAWLEQ